LAERRQTSLNEPFSDPLAFIEGLGGPEILLILVIVLVLFGGEKLPGFARGLGKSIREFKKAASGVEEEFKRALDEDEHKHRSALPPPPTTFPPYPPAVSYTEPPVASHAAAAAGTVPRPEGVIAPEPAPSDQESGVHSADATTGAGASVAQPETVAAAPKPPPAAPTAGPTP
jgi:sec-independent protein translocase protein TatA